MFELSSKTQVNKKFRLTELFKSIQADKTIKEDAKNITSIILSNVLSNSTMNLSSQGTVKELYIFDVELSDKEIPATFISALDKAILLHTAFVLHNNGKEMLYCAYKERTEKGVKIGKYYSTSWMDPANTVTLPLNIGSIDDVYTTIIDYLIPIEARPEENTSQFVDRYETIVKLQREIDKLQREVDSEKQSKKRFELNASLKALKEKLLELEKK